MAKVKMLPVGIDGFEKIRKAGFYYVDKSKLIEQLLQNWGEVNLFTRPRRFGKTLNMSMLKSFFEIGTDTTLFNGLYILNNNDLCEKYMGKYPVIFLSLKDVAGLTYAEAEDALVQLIGSEAGRFHFLTNSSALSDAEKEQYRGFTIIQNGKYRMDKGLLISALRILSQLLYRHYGQKVIILIDEYDVPLDKAFQHGYYQEMVSLIRGMFGQALKTNSFLQFAVLTGCLRISKESIFTGLNNFKVYSAADARYDEAFGFTDEEVKKILADYQLQEHYAEVKEWYDGYHFGNVDVYCPWDVINHVDRIKDDPMAGPEAYWINTSGNELVKRFIDKAGKTTRDEIERLIAGEAIDKQIRLDMTYDEIDNNIDNLWSVLFTTGYLTYTKISEDKKYNLVIPNKEIKEVFKLQIQEWFRNKIFSNTEQLQDFWKAFKDGNTQIMEMYLNKVLSNSVSVFDTKARNEEKESSYHNLLIGILSGNEDWLVKSNVEAGEGFADIIVETDDPDEGIIAELKYTKDFKAMEKSCEKALKQIKDRRYQEYLLNNDRQNIMYYGIAFCRKRCKVLVER